MSTSARAASALFLALFVAACAPQPAPVVAYQEPLSVEPTDTGPYK